MKFFNVYGKVDLVKTLAVVAAVGYVWFGHLSTEAANAAANAQFCLIAAGALTIAFLYLKNTQDSEFNERDSIWRGIEQTEDRLRQEISEIHREVGRIHDRLDECGKSCSKR